MVFSHLIELWWNIICIPTECWWWRLTQLSYSPGVIFSNGECGTLYYPSWATHGNAWHSVWNTQNFCAMTVGFAAVRFMSVPSSLGVVTNTEGFCQSWNLSCISACSLLPISTSMWNIPTWSAEYLVSQYFKWCTLPGTGQKSTTFCAGVALGSAHLLLSCSYRTILHDALSWLGSGHLAGSWTYICRNLSVSKWKIVESI